MTYLKGVYEISYSTFFERQQAYKHALKVYQSTEAYKVNVAQD